MTTSQELLQKTLDQYGRQLTDETILKAIREGDAKAAIDRANQLLEDAPAPSHGRLMLDATGAQPLTNEERQAAKLRNFVTALDGVMKFSSTVNAALADVHASARRHH